MSNGESVADWWRTFVVSYRDRQEAIEDAYQHLENAGLISKVTVHRYLCQKCHKPVGTVIRAAGDEVIARTSDYKLAPGTNLAQSVASARAKNTLDGNRHWPGPTFDVSHLASFGESAAIAMNCRCRLRNVPAGDILATIQGVRPGHPGSPTRF